MAKPSLPLLVEEVDFNQIDDDASLLRGFRLRVDLLPESESRPEPDFDSGSDTESTHLVPSSPLRSPFLPNFIKSPLKKSPFTKSPLIKNAKRRSVVAAQPYGESRMKSLKQKQEEGKTSLNDLICSPTAQKNGCLNNSPEKKPILTKMKRRSVMAAQPFAQSRLTSVKSKQKLGKTSLSALIQSPSAQKNGHFFAEEEDDDEDAN